jgi:DNA-binding MarR family transcriptional regulator
LTEREQRAWRAFVAVSSVVMAELDAELEAAHGMSLGEYAVLVELSEAPEQRLRMTDLAGRLHLSPSGLTRRFDRLARQGLVTRESCPTDRRAVYAGLTPAGLQRLEDAAPDHVAGVRRLLVDRLDEAQLDQLADALEMLRSTCDDLRADEPPPAVTRAVPAPPRKAKPERGS